MQRITIATRKSRLALWQTEHVADRLRALHPGLEVELLPLSTRGDEVLDRSLAEIGGKGLFLKELEHALLDGRADIAVHSLKDVPAEQPEGLELAAWLPRANPVDLWITRDGCPIEQLPAGARVGSSSLRRISQLRSVRGDLEIGPLRGNVETRLAAVREGRVDATILAAAGLERLDIVPEGARPLPPERWLPAPGQGIVVVQQRSGEADLAARLAGLDCSQARVQAAAERAVVAALGGDCRMPLAAFAQFVGDDLVLRARLGDEQGGLIDAEVSGPVSRAEQLGDQAAEDLLARGGRELLQALAL
ncbi:MAG: hydroxymethylbilane synthase [Wenzhouxiangellaceae bacterium]|nr:hydroxymethylbilane synthase [Wenzhouxiangellaceae bacterium]